MDALEEVVGGPNCTNQDLSHSHIVKGKRTKRSRPHSPLSFTMITTTTPPPHYSSPAAATAAGDDDNATSSAPAIDPIPTPEDEYMARCLMLLSQGGGVSRHPPAIPKSPLYKEEDGGGNKFCSKKYIETTTVGGGGGGVPVKVGMYVYECKTCGRTFPTFQALGGHRTSHTKEKPPLTGEAAAKRPLSLYDEEDINNPYPFNKAPKISPTFSSLHFYDSAKSSPRIHECSYCGAEFSSGQALGGHMRRHRNSTAAAAAAASPSSSSLEKKVVVLQKEEDNNNGKSLNWDLNLLPAGEDNNQDHRRARELPENQEQQPPQVEPTLFLSTTPPLVGCKYI